MESVVDSTVRGFGFGFGFGVCRRAKRGENCSTDYISYI